MAHLSSEKGVVIVYTESQNLIPTALPKARRFCSVCPETFIKTGKPRDGKGDTVRNTQKRNTGFVTFLIKVPS